MLTTFLIEEYDVRDNEVRKGMKLVTLGEICKLRDTVEVVDGF